MKRPEASLATLALCLWLPLACSANPTDSGYVGSPEGPVAENASEAWPEAPENVPAVTPQDILSACSLSGSCSDEVMQLDVTTRTGLIDLCVHDAVFSAERAIPLSGFRQGNERIEFWARCVLDSADDCSAVQSCWTERAQPIHCEEDGCRASESLAVTCQGSVAQLSGKSGTWSRDCSRAFAQCDPDSPTGCTDRHYTRCPTDMPTADRCDAEIRLGCDGSDQVSYHDCSRLGGSCTMSNDGFDCVYAHPPSPECGGSSPASASCQGGVLSACVNGLRVSLQSSLCSAQ